MQQRTLKFGSCWWRRTKWFRNWKNVYVSYEHISQQYFSSMSAVIPVPFKLGSFVEYLTHTSDKITRKHEMPRKMFFCYSHINISSDGLILPGLYSNRRVLRHSDAHASKGLGQKDKTQHLFFGFRSRRPQVYIHVFLRYQWCPSVAPDPRRGSSKGQVWWHALLGTAPDSLWRHTL